MNLSKIKTVGFIINFNPKSSYPELGYQKPVKAAPVVKSPKSKRANDSEYKAIKAAKKEFKKTVVVGYKPRTIVKSSII